MSTEDSASLVQRQIERLAQEQAPITNDLHAWLLAELTRQPALRERLSAEATAWLDQWGLSGTDFSQAGSFI